ncbi:hypothetical protein ACTFIU_001830 [Dictyostelium citrinum]
MSLIEKTPEKDSNENGTTRFKIDFIKNNNCNKVFIADENETDTMLFETYGIPPTPTSTPFSTPISTPRSHSSSDFLFTINEYNFIKTISKGGYGEVFLATNQSNEFFAIKVINKCNIIKKKMVKQLMNERNIMVNYQNKFMVKLFECFQTDEKVFFVMEYLYGGDFGSFLKKFCCLEEDYCKLFIAQIVLGLEYIHNSGIVHRDLKPENLLFDADGNIKLVDFGFSETGFNNNKKKNNNNKKKNKKKNYNKNKNNKNSNKMKESRILGTPYYISPEIINGNEYGKTVDWWSLGIMVYEILTGDTPYDGNEPTIILKHITQRSNDIYWPESLSPVAVDFIKGLLTVNPLKRLGANGSGEVKNHPFFAGINWDDVKNLKYKKLFRPSIDSNYNTSYFLQSGPERKHDIDKSIVIDQSLFLGFNFSNL